MSQVSFRNRPSSSVSLWLTITLITIIHAKSASCGNSKVSVPVETRSETPETTDHRAEVIKLLGPETVAELTQLSFGLETPRSGSPTGTRPSLASVLPQSAPNVTKKKLDLDAAKEQEQRDIFVTHLNNMLGVPPPVKKPETGSLTKTRTVKFATERDQRKESPESS
ncbi:hypothetical protein DdX_10562 [Ditylenchus destructor]|uniref:Uncharacterized protein n=1 Tax=Ditylenchus destructor TaxID=166010 RepID=A0AAD4QZ80_9BILA|nr:hypothetical protein DdX_10562 [Ditylenchus destructor]